jgi:hypothetical protein
MTPKQFARAAMTLAFLVAPAAVTAQTTPPPAQPTPPPLPQAAPPVLPPQASAPSPLPTEAPPPAYAPTAPPAYAPPAPPPPQYATYADPYAQPAPPPPPPAAETAKERGPFSRGRLEVSGLIGTTFLDHRSYLILGVGVGYYLVDGLNVALGGSLWLLDSPTAGTLTPSVTYVLHMVPLLKPYVGGFFRHYIVGSNVSDFNSLGVRFGVNLVPAHSRSYFGLGAVYEGVLSCDTKVRNCDGIYPELTFAVSI